ncbi:hypothetical protein BKA82DRAFT_129352, partial [Pisolithus tinctorius]
QKLFQEVNVLYWAKSLLKLTYDFINSAVTSSVDCPPFYIPHVCFVKAGLALSYTGHPQSNSKGPSTCAIFLVEELIPGRSENFTKFIHNSSAVSLLDLGESGYDLTVFFSFMQHVQYVKTGGLALILDFHGTSTNL